jgi:hypothetical protein
MTSPMQGRKPPTGAEPLPGAHGVAPREVTQGSEPVGGVTPSLLAAALSGLLCLSGCGSDGSGPKQAGRDGSAGGAGQDAASEGDAAPGAPAQDQDATARVDAGAGSAPDASDFLPDASFGDAAAEDAGEHDPTPRITESRVDKDVTEESFRAECDKRNGTFEVHPGCGGANSCRGMSYDVDSHVYTEHTCQGLNTCRGFSCVLPKQS